MKLVFCGGAGEVGASCVLLVSGGKNIVLDSGIRMNNADSLPGLNLIQENGGADAICVSHAHLDHSGSLPVLSREFPDAKIYMTHAAKDLTRVLLADSLKIMDQQEAEIPIYAEIHVKNALDRIVCFSPGYTFRPFNDEEITITFYSAGHVAGAVAIYITSPEGSCFYSGDFSAFPQKTVEGAAIPRRLRPDLAIFESTYGDRLHSNREIEEGRLVAKVREVIAAGKKILIPAFALGRAQEVILILKKALNKGELPKFPIYVDGMVKDICRVYKLNPNYLHHFLTKKLLKGLDVFYDENVTPVTGRQAQREAIVSQSGPCCIISSSGMLTGGPSQWYAQKLAGDAGNYIAITGYQDEESPGNRLLELAELPPESERLLKLGEVSLPVHCGLGKYGLSAHADKSEIVSLVHSLGARNVFLVHGNPTTTAALAKELQTEYRGQIYVPANGESFDIKIAAPRKQLEKKLLPTLDKQTEPQRDDLPELWRFILDERSPAVGFTVEELFYIWSGKKAAVKTVCPQFGRLVNTSRYFQPETRRPFIFHTVAPDALAEEDPTPALEVNQMLALADQWFPPQTGLYKKGARVEGKIALLYFNFPTTAQQKYSEKFTAFASETGWSVQVNTECNLIAAQDLVLQLLGDDAPAMGKFSYFPVENRFKIQLYREVTDFNRIQATFQELTGMELLPEVFGANPTPVNAPVKAAADQAEQNQALAAIQETFATREDKLYKKSLKLIAGKPTIELSFISPQVGERYRKIIDQLESRLRWPIQINPAPNQNEILNTGRRLLVKNQVRLNKNLSFLPKEQRVVAHIQPTDSGLLDGISAEFLKVTGLEISFEVQ
jgi:Cft2 family RNA processing exonuclease